MPRQRGGEKKAGSKPPARIAAAGGKKKPPSPPRAAKPPIAEQVSLPGGGSAAFKLVWRAEDSFFLYRSSRKLGTARVEPDGSWTARFEATGGAWLASAGDGRELLQRIGTFLLAGEARAAASRPVEDVDPTLRIMGRKTPEERLSIEFARRASANRIAQLDRLREEVREHIRKAPK